MGLLMEARREGLSFEAAWERAIRPGQRLVLMSTRDAPPGALRWPTDSGDRNEWRAALESARDDIRRAYEQRPVTPRERGVVLLSSVLGEGSGMAGDAAIPSAA